MNPPLFQLRTDATLDELTGELYRLVHQTKAVQSSLFEMVCGKEMIREHFIEINELTTQTEGNLAYMVQLVEALDSKTLKEVKK